MERKEVLEKLNKCDIQIKKIKRELSQIKLNNLDNLEEKCKKLEWLKFEYESIVEPDMGELEKEIEEIGKKNKNGNNE